MHSTAVKPLFAHIWLAADRKANKCVELLTARAFRGVFLETIEGHGIACGCRTNIIEYHGGPMDPSNHVGHTAHLQAFYNVAYDCDNQKPKCTLLCMPFKFARP